jgi:uncharacterized protein with LGFP repeats
MAEVIGAIRDKWLRLGGEGFSGPALDVERPTFDGVGRAQSFQNGVTIYWTPQTGAHEVHGAIREARKKIRYERSLYG